MVTDALIEKKLIELRKRLSHSPSDVKELLPLLEELELFLSRIEQSPPEPIWNALEPIMKHITLKTFMKHPDKGIKLAVASCLSEITRVTAPDAPFDDNTMKDIFRLIIRAFEEIHDLSSPWSQRRINILETCARIRLSVLLLDLECDDMIYDMFHHFLKNLRCDHSQTVFTSMESIMTLVIEESEDITSELLFDLLGTLKLDNKDILPIAQRLARKVMTNSADKIRACLMRLVELNRIILSEYNEVVATICQGGSEALINKELNSSGEIMEDGSKLSERTVSDELPQVSTQEDHEVACPKNFNSTSNGDIRLDNGDSVEQPSTSEQKSELSRRNANIKSSEFILESATVNQDGASNINRLENPKINSSTKKVTPVTHFDSSNEKDCQKKSDTVQDDNDMTAMNVDSEKKHDTNKSELNSSKGKGQSNKRAKSKKSKGGSGSKVSKKTTVGALDSKATPLKGDKSEETENTGDVTNVLKVKDENNSTKKGQSNQKLSENELSENKQKHDNPNENQPISSKGKAQNSRKAKPKASKGRNVSKPAGKIINDVSAIHSTAVKGSEPQKTEDASDNGTAIKGDESKDNEGADDVMNVPEGREECNSSKVGRSKRKFSENGLSKNKKKPNPKKQKKKEESDIHSTAVKGSKPQKTEDASDNGTSIKGDESKDNEGADDVVNVPEGKEERNSSKVGQSKRKFSENDLSKNKKKPNPKKQKKKEESEENVDAEPTLKEFISVHRSASKALVLDQTPTSKSKSKRMHAVDTKDNYDSSDRKENHSLVGSVIEVWWPDDEQFYSGVVDSYEPDTKKHKIVYNDGEVEVLMLKEERYKLNGIEIEKTVDNQTSQKAEGGFSKLGTTTSKGKGVPRSRGKNAGSSRSRTPKTGTKQSEDAENVTPEGIKKLKTEAPKSTAPKADENKNTKSPRSKPRANSSSASKASGNSGNKSKTEGNEGGSSTPVASENNAASGGRKRNRKGGNK